MGIDCHCRYFFGGHKSRHPRLHTTVPEKAPHHRQSCKNWCTCSIWVNHLFHFVYFKGFLDLSWTFDSFRLDNVFAFGQLSSMNWRYKCFNSFRKPLRRLYDHLTRPNLSKYHIFYGSFDTIQWTFSMVTFVVQPHKRLIRSNGTSQNLKYNTWSKLSSHPVTPHVQILTAYTVLTFNFKNNFLQTPHWSHSIMVWSFSDNNDVIVFYLSLDVKMATRCGNAEALITKIGTLNDILLHICVTLCKVNLDHKVVWVEWSLHFLIRIDLPSCDVNMFFKNDL